MNRTLVLLCTLLGLAWSTNQARADGNAWTPHGSEPWWNVFAKRDKCLTPEEERLQKFWHDHYAAMKQYYAGLDHIDWVAYYKNYGYQINAGCACPGCCNKINYAPVFVTPTMQWSVPNDRPGAPSGLPSVSRR